MPHNLHLLPICHVLLLFGCKRSKINIKMIGHDSEKKLYIKKKRFSDLPTHISLDMSLETHFGGLKRRGRRVHRLENTIF